MQKVGTGSLKSSKSIESDPIDLYDVFNNFLLRWNSAVHSFGNVFDSMITDSWIKKNDILKYMIDPLSKGPGSANVQICRSASATQKEKESSSINKYGAISEYNHDDWKHPDPVRRKIFNEKRLRELNQQQTSIRDAMINCIRAAQAFIYIENQFFVSDCGDDQNGTTSIASNQIIAELANAVGQAIEADRSFHIYLVLPEQPEGLLEDSPINSQLWWALQGVRHAEYSLVNRVNRFILQKNMKKFGINKLPKTSREVQKILTENGIPNQWENYLTVLNLRNYGHTQKAVLSEMVYVHAKILIVDDAAAIIGSANINDRSLNGDGDTELSALIIDTSDSRMTDVGGADMCGTIKVVTNKFARNLRINIWKKHLGLEIEHATTGVQKQTLPAGIILEKPLDPGTIKGIKGLAKNNREAYNKVFKHTPRNSFATLEEGRKLYPFIFEQVQKYKEIQGPTGPAKIFVPNKTMDGKPTKKHDFSKTPLLQPDYMMKDGQHNIGAAIGKLREAVKGFWVEMPLDWGRQLAKTPPAPLRVNPSIANAEQAEISQKEVMG